MKGDPSNLMSLPSPLGKPFFFGIPIRMMTGWLFNYNIGVACFLKSGSDGLTWKQALTTCAIYKCCITSIGQQLLPV
jgi:hypothetical protein